MASSMTSSRSERSRTQWLVPLGVVAIVIMLVVPLPTQLLDLLLALNITGSLLVLLIAMRVERTLDFSLFPSLLLVATLFRLALNVSATRLVLLHGDAGNVIDSFGHVVVGGSLVVGLVVFVILIVIQFVVITNGAGRVAEVAARFTLDAMPGKQMAIDADLNAGLIGEDEARQRRKDVSAEADFYGAMDGASKFVKGDAIAAVLITMINLIGGMAIGVAQRGMSVGDAVQTYSLLSIGDGLVSQIPALCISIATGIIVTRAATDGDMGSELGKQFAKQRSALTVAGGAMIVFGLVPGLPMMPFLTVGAAVVVISRRLPDPDAAPTEPLTCVEPAAPSDTPRELAAETQVEPLELQVAYDLVDLVDPGSGGDLLDRMRSLRRKVALEIGLVIPPVRTRDQVDLPPGTYVIRVNGVEVARGQARSGCVLVIGDGLEGLGGEATQEPVFGLAARWVPEALRSQAEMSGGTVVDRTSVIVTHLAEVVRRLAGQLLSREDVKALVDVVRTSSPTVVEELTPSLLSLGDVQQVLQSLLSEGVPIRDLSRIFESLSQRAKSPHDAESLVEAARSTLGAAVTAPYVVGGRLPVLSLEPRLEHLLLELLRTGENGSFLAVDPALAEHVATSAAELAQRAEQLGHVPVLVCAPALRPALRHLVEGAAPGLPVVTYRELGGLSVIETVGVVRHVSALAA